MTKYDGMEIEYSGVGLPDYVPSSIDYADDKYLTWDAQGRLASAFIETQYTANYTYDANGMRKTKTYRGTTHEYFYEGSRLLCEKINGKHLYFLYDESGNIDALRYNGAKYYLIRNLQGDVIQIRNASNGLVAVYKYNAYGYLISVQTANGSEITNEAHIALINPIRYRGYYYDNELKMYYLQSRYYNPEMCRFISADAIVSTDAKGMNLFAYCYNDPVNYSDPYGYCGACIPGVYYAGKEISCDLMRDGHLEWKEAEKRRGQMNMEEAETFVRGVQTVATAFETADEAAEIVHSSSSLEVSGPSLDLMSGDIGLGSISYTAYSDSFQNNAVDLSLISFGNAEATLGVSDGTLNIGAYASIWNPSISLNLGDITITLGAEVGAIGLGFEVGTSGVKFSGSKLIGGSISIGW